MSVPCPVFSLSELLGEWKDERREQLLQEVGQLLKVRSSPSGWAADRLTYQVGLELHH